MEFPFNVTNVLPKEFTFVDNTLVLKEWNSNSRNRDEYSQLYDIIDVIGEASSFAQGLNRVITTSDKLQNSEHFLYLMTDRDGNMGHSLVVGMLKIGRKKLFILDHQQKTHEVAPLCVLDFYIHESRQRRGYGRRLFDYMLQHQNVYPGHMAIDKPSEKFIQFYARHYHLTKQIPQINNFAIYDVFFQERPIATEESVMTQNRSNRSSCTASPESSSPISTRRAQQQSNIQQGYAGKPSRQRDTNMSDILQGKTEGFVPSVRCSSRHQTTLDWMRSNHQGGREGIYGNRTPYSASRTPSYSGSPCRTPKNDTPPRSHPATPPVYASQKKDVVDSVQCPDISVGPTPASSPLKRDIEIHHESIENGYKKEEFEELNEQFENASLSDEPVPGRTGGWRDSISRATEDIVEHMTPKGTTMSGVLKDNESVHGHLKFHHHALW